MDYHYYFDLYDNIFHGFLGYFYVYTLTREWRYSSKAVRKILITVCVLFAAVSSLILWKIGLTSSAKIYITLLGLASGIPVCIYLPKYRDGRALFVCLSATSFDLASIAVGEVAGSTDTILRILIKIVIYAVIFMLVYRYFRKPLNRLMDEMEEGWHRLSLMPLSFSVLCLFLLLSGQVYHDKFFKFIAMALIFVLVCSYVAVYHMFCILQEQYRLRSNYALLDTQMTSLQNQMEMMETTNEQLRIFCHDIRHYIALQRTFLDQKDMKSAGELLASMEQTLDNTKKNIVEYTDSPYINAVVANYSEKMHTEDIRFSVDMTSVASMNIEQIELAVVIANALENAWKACLDIPREKGRYITLFGVQKEKQYLLEIKNTCQNRISFNKEHTLPVTSEKGHGYGVQSIAAFAEKYNAYLDFRQSDENFMLRMILPLSQ